MHPRRGIRERVMLKCKPLAFVVVVAAALSAMGGGARADTIYTYTGNNFTDVAAPPYTTSDHISGFIDLAIPLGDNATNVNVSPVSFSFSDGVQTISSLQTTLGDVFNFFTNAVGDISSWNVFIMTEGRSEIQSQNLTTIGARDVVFDSGTLFTAGASNIARPGAWTVSTTPLPATLPLFATGLGAMGLLGWRRKRKNAAALATS